VIQLIKKGAAKAAGLQRYFTGKPCPKGHAVERYVADGKCIECVRLKTAGRSDYQKLWRSRNPDKGASYTRAYRERNPDYKERDKATRLARIDNDRARARLHYAANKEHFAEKSRKYREENRDLIAAYARNRRSLKKGAEGCHTRAEIACLCERQGWKCAVCRESIRGKRHADHIVPLVLGGSNWISNIQMLCPTCNLQKSAKDPIVFAHENWRLL